MSGSDEPPTSSEDWMMVLTTIEASSPMVTGSAAVPMSESVISGMLTVRAVASARAAISGPRSRALTSMSLRERLLMMKVLDGAGSDVGAGCEEEVSSNRLTLSRMTA